VALELFGKLQQKSTLQFLQAYPTPQEAMAASVEQIKVVLKHGRYPHPTAEAATIVEQLHQQQGPR